MRGLIYKEFQLFLKSIDKKLIIIAGIGIAFLMIKLEVFAGLVASLILAMVIGMQSVMSFVSDEKINFAIKNIGLIKTSTLKEDAYFIFLQLSSDRLKKYVQTNQAGSTQQYISLTNLRKMPIIQPKWNELSGFNEITGNISLEIRKVVDENATLIEIRNKLLPRILSGELEI